MDIGEEKEAVYVHAGRIAVQLIVNEEAVFGASTQDGLTWTMTGAFRNPDPAGGAVPCRSGVEGAVVTGELMRHFLSAEASEYMKARVASLGGS